MQMYTPKEMTMLISQLSGRFDLPESNVPNFQKELADLYLANIMASTGAARKKDIVSNYKSDYEDAITELEVNQETEISKASPFTLLCKKSNPRKSFDKDAFIKRVAKEHDISIMELNSIAKETVKESVAPLSFMVTLND